MDKKTIIQYCSILFNRVLNNERDHASKSALSEPVGVGNEESPQSTINRKKYVSASSHKNLQNSGLTRTLIWKKETMRVVAWIL